MSPQKKYCTFIGRWQPPHNGHKWLFDQMLSQGKNILIMIRDIVPDENQPLWADEVKGLLETMYFGDDRVKIMIIPDIEGVYYGRGVGYEVKEYLPNFDIASISATGIRESIRSGNDDWKSKVDPSIHDKLRLLFDV